MYQDQEHVSGPGAQVHGQEPRYMAQTLGVPVYRSLGVPVYQSLGVPVRHVPGVAPPTRTMLVHRAHDTHDGFDVFTVG